MHAYLSVYLYMYMEGVFFHSLFFFFLLPFFFFCPLGPLVLWSRGPLVPWSSGPVVLWSRGPLVFWVPWSGAAPWSPGLLKYIRLQVYLAKQQI